MVKKIQLARIARVCTTPLSVITQLKTQLDALGKTGAVIMVITSPDFLQQEIKSIQNCVFKPLSIYREINLIKDLIALIRLIFIFRKEQFDIVHSNTPKAGLLCAMAAKIARVPIRLHTFTGQPWVTLKGPKRMILRCCDKLISYLNTHCYADSLSQRQFLIDEGIIQSPKISVIGNGSISGVDLVRFNSQNFSQLDKQSFRNLFHIKEDELVVLFIGRITRDKGIFELIQSFHELITLQPNIKLIIAGPFEQEIEKEVRSFANSRGESNIIFSGFCHDPENLLAISDMLCLPSYREGFGTVVIEAAAMEIPTVGTKIYGLTDSIIDGVTGLLVKPKNVQELTQALLKLILNKDLRAMLGKNAKKRVYQDFDSHHFEDLIIQEYEKLLSNEKPSIPSSGKKVKDYIS